MASTLSKVLENARSQIQVHNNFDIIQNKFELLNTCARMNGLMELDCKHIASNIELTQDSTLFKFFFKEKRKKEPKSETI